MSDRHAEGYGPIGNNHGAGLLVHSLPALTPAGEVLGLGTQHSSARALDPPHKQTETRSQRHASLGKESEVWPQLLEAVGPVPQDRLLWMVRAASLSATRLRARRKRGETRTHHIPVAAYEPVRYAGERSSTEQMVNGYRASRASSRAFERNALRSRESISASSLCPNTYHSSSVTTIGNIGRAVCFQCSY
jgi:hypothetical protein